MNSFLRLKKINIFDSRLIFGIFIIQPFLFSSFYFHQISLAPAPFVAILFSLYYLKWEKKGSNDTSKYITIKANLSFWWLIAIVISSSFISLVYVFAYGYMFRAHGLIGSILGASTLLAFDRYASASLEKYIFNIRLFLIISLCFFYYQFFSYFIFGVDIDYMVNFTGEEQRLIGHSRYVEGIGSFKRSSGLFAEPAVYANFTIALLVGLLCLNSCGPILLILTLSSVLLSFSTTGFALSALPIFLALRSGRKLRLAVLFIAVGIFFKYWDVFENLFSNEITRLSSGGLDDESGASRLWFLEFVLSKPMVAIGGFGFLLDLRDIVPPSLFVASAIYYFGIPISIILFLKFIIFAKKLFSYTNLSILILLGLFFNYAISSPFFWFIFSLLFVCLKNSNTFNSRRLQCVA